MSESEDNKAVQQRLREKLAVMSALVDRLELAGSLGQQFGGDRDMYEILGYPVEIRFAHYLGKYDRQDIAGKVVDLPAIDTWRKPPIIKDGDSDTSQDAPASKFIAALKQVINARKVWHYLQRVDRLSGIGRFGVLLVGVTGDLPLSEALPPGSLKLPGDVIYFSAFSENSVTIQEIDKDPHSPRFGLPIMYSVKFSETGASERVHWSRCLHVAEDLLEDEVYGRPRLKRIYNLLEDLLKIVGGGSEATWKTMDRGLQADIRDDYTGDTQTLTELETEIDEYLHGLRRFIRTKGVDINDLGSQTVDPSGLFDIVISLVAAASGIPQRILIGSERGELASGQDQANWAGIIAARQTQFAEPTMLRPLIDQLVVAGALPVPDSGVGNYKVKWPSLFEKSDSDKATVANTYAGAIAAYAPGGASDMVVPIPEFREKFLGLPADLPEEAILNAEDATPQP